MKIINLIVKRLNKAKIIINRVIKKIILNY